MKAIILAAGIGKRLGPTSENKPKCLLKFGGISLLQRHLQNLMKFSVSEIVIVYGYQKDLIDVEISQFNSEIPLTTIYNPDYTRGSVVSLWCAIKFLKGGTDIILMDADVLYDPRILQRLIQSENKNSFLLDREFEPGDEPVKLCIRNDKIIEFRKEIDQELEFDDQGESVGFFRFTPEIAGKLGDRAQQYINNGRHEEPYEESIRDLLLSEQDSFAFEDITGLPWVEIDFPEDLERANRLLTNINSVQICN